MMTSRKRSLGKRSLGKRSLGTESFGEKSIGMQTIDKPHRKKPRRKDTSRKDFNQNEQVWSEPTYEGTVDASPGTAPRSPRRVFTRGLALALALALVAPWGYAQNCPHQGRSTDSTVVPPTSGDIVNCSTGQEVSVVGVGTSTSSMITCPRFTTTGISFSYPTGKWNHEVTDSMSVEDTRTEYTCSNFSILWGLYASNKCSETLTVVIQSEIHVISDAFCAVLTPPLVLPLPPKRGEPSEYPGVSALPQPTSGGN